MKQINYKRISRRKKRISANILGTKEKPRISIFRSNLYIYAQVIDDQERKTLATFSSINLKKDKEYKKDKKTAEAKKVGIKLAAIIKEMKIAKGVFDRGRYAYNGRVKALAEGLREGGIVI
jgi:large subunit ribosomal protein L18